MAEFHFLRPWWLVALPAGAWLIWRLARGGRARGGWRAVVDPVLQPYVLARPSVTGERRWPILAAMGAWVAAILALSGPTWERVPVPAFRSDEALVVAFDLSRSMDAADVEPSRLVRARLKLLSLLDRRESGQIGLVVFSAHAFTVTPLTTDTRTIASLVGALSSSIMPSRGSLPEAGLRKAGELLRQAGMTDGEILLISDADVSPQSREAARELRDEGYRVHVLAVGTEDGAPIRDPRGGFVTDDRGEVVVPGLNPAGLRRLAEAGGGRFARLAPDDSDLERLFPAQAAPGALAADAAEEEGEDYRADVWRDQGVWLSLLLLPLAALSFRRGWLCAWLLVVLLPGSPAQAFEWSDLWQRRDQRGLEALQADDAERAARLFEDPEWRGAALYRSGEYAESAAALEGVDAPDGHYNRGNALARAGDLRAAITAYDRALELEPDHEDARYNRDLVSELLEQQEQESGSRGSEPQQGSDPGEQAAEGASGQGEPPEGGEPQGDPSGGDRSDTASASAGDETDGDGGEQQPPEPRQAEAGADGTPSGEPEPGEADAPSAPAPEDLEQWASEQAADQWLRRIPQDPGGLLRRKFLYQYQRLGVDQDGNYVWPGDESAPW